MPELPEVEIARRALERWLGPRRIVDAVADRSRIFRGADRRGFEAIRGRLHRADRRGKYLMLSFDENRGLLSHLGMTGKWVRRSHEASEPYSRARFLLDDGSVVHYRDPRLFGRMEPAPAHALAQLPVVRALGRDPLQDGLTGAQLRSALGSTRLPLKVALMDQSRVAGLGNIHAAEALFRARLHPGYKISSVTPAEWTRLAGGIRKGLAFALAKEDADEIAYVEEPGTPNPFRVYGRGGEPCVRCGSRIRSMAQGGRTTYFCPHCQPARRARR